MLEKDEIPFDLLEKVVGAMDSNSLCKCKVLSRNFNELFQTNYFKGDLWILIHYSIGV